MPTLKARLRSRWPYLLMYLSLMASGIVVGVAPTPGARQQLGFFLAVWIIFFIVGGAAGAYGIMRGTWFGEAFGLPLLATALLVYAVIIGLRFFTVIRTPGLLAFALLLFGFAFGLLGRWREVLRFLRTARELPHNGH